jgi:hypothetical protein
MLSSLLKHIALFPLVLTLQFFNTTRTATEGDKVPCNHFIIIRGSSNVNEFEFVNFNARITSNSSSEIWDQEIRIPISSFEGPNKYMINDFQQLLKSSQYPYIKIKIQHQDLLSEKAQSINTVSPAIITIAGTSKKIELPLQISKCDQTGFIVQGDLELKLTDFFIQPPEKVFGAVRVHDKVFITFAIRFKPEQLLTQN